VLWSGRNAEEVDVKEIAPTGKLRVGVVYAPVATAFFVTKDAQGKPHGVTVDLANELAAKLGVPIEFTVAPNSGEVTEATSSGALDVSFMPVDDERRKKVDFGPSYFLGESTYLVRPGSDIKTLAEVDRAHVRVIGIANTTTIRSAARALKAAKIAPVPSVEQAMAMMRAGEADASVKILGRPPLFEGRADFGEHRADLAANRCDRGDDDHGDQRGDKRILDRRDA